MRQLVGNLKKMTVRHSDIIQYWLSFNGEELYLNELLGKKITIKFLDQIICLNCSRSTKSSFNQGFCYPCFIKLASCDTCILKPEQCHYHLGTCREPKWGEINCMMQHYVYLANSSSLKVGITRTSQVPMRWIDQGASYALPIMLVATRLYSGLAEIALGEYLSDKTNWRNMLQNKIEVIDLLSSRDKLFMDTELKIKELQEMYGQDAFMQLNSTSIMSFNYPVLEYPKKISTISLDKQKVAEGILHGIKGQYLLLDTGVINIRKHTGYLVEFTID